MGRRKLRSVSPSSSTLKTKKSKISDSSSIFEKNPVIERFQMDWNHAIIGIDDENQKGDNSIIINEGNESNPDEVDPIFDDLLRVMELSVKSKQGRGRSTKGEVDVIIDQERNHMLVEKSVRSLLTYIRESRPTLLNSSDEHGCKTVNPVPIGSFLSADEIIRVLLPWSVKGILQDAYKKQSSSLSSQEVKHVSKSLELLHWKSLNECLSFFFGHLEKEKDRGAILSKNWTRNNSLNILTLSTLHKLVPTALQLALKESCISNADTNENIACPKTLQEIASVCFCQLVDHLYRPPFDVVCDSLLPILTRDIAKVGVSQTSITWLSVTVSTLRLMKLRVTSANPKKSFLLLIRPKTLLDLSLIDRNTSNPKHLQGRKNPFHKEHLNSIERLLNDLICNGLFSLDHHIDNFQSLRLEVPTFDENPKKKGRSEKVSAPGSPEIRVYQKGLFSTLEGIFFVSDKEDDAAILSSQYAASVSCILPRFLSIFFEQVSKLQKQYEASKSIKKGKTIEKLGHLQFQFFSCLSTYLIEGLEIARGTVFKTQMHVSELRGLFLSMLGKNLDLLLKHNVYQPSLRNNAERSFLDEIGKRMIQSMTAIGADKNLSYTEWKNSLIILDVLIQLNHTILHDELAEILGKCLTYNASIDSGLAASGICEEAFSFFLSVITTYGKLRQLDYFYSCLFDAVKVLSTQKDVRRIIQFLAFADDNRISICLGKIIQGSPIHQQKQIFSNVNDSIVNQWCNEENKFIGDVMPIAISIVTKFLVGLLRDVRVDSNSYITVYQICDNVMNGSVMSLMRCDRLSTESTSNKIGYMNNAVIICAWTIHLRNRCEFWVDKKRIDIENENFEIPSALQLLLKDAIASTGDNVVRNKRENLDLMESLKFLACQRIQQLHKKCYEKQKLAYAVSASQFSTTLEISEARKLVGFILQKYDTTESDARSTSEIVGKWTILAESLTIWAPYADQSDIDSFLNQVFQTLSKDNKEFQHERILLKSLLNDASFYEIRNVSERLGTNIASFIAENMQKALSLCSGSSSQSEISCSIAQTSWKTLSFEEVSNANIGGVLQIRDRNDLPEINEVLRKSLRVLETVNTAGIPIWKECQDSSKILQSILRIESICNILFASKDSSFLDIRVSLISALRITASRLLASVPFNSTSEILKTQEVDFLSLLPHILENSFNIIDLDSSSRTVDQCIQSCTILTTALINTYAPLDLKSRIYMVKVLDSTFDQKEVEQGGFQHLILTNYAIALLRKFDNVIVTGSDDVTIKDLFHVVKKRIWKLCYEYFFNTPSDTQVLFQNQSTVFIAEALRLSSTCSDMSLIPLSSVAKKIITRLRILSTHNSEQLETRSISYLVGCLARAKPSRNIRYELTNEILQANLNRYDVFLSPFCILVRGMDDAEFEELLNKLISDIVEVPTTVRKLKLVHKIVLSTTNQSQIALLSKYSVMIMNNCLQVMAQVAMQIDVDSDSIIEVSSLVVDMASKKDLLVLREREIALIIGRITSTINVDKKSWDGELAGLQLKSYNACFSLLSLFLQRFSKQLHNCVSLLVISLSTMLQFTLSESLPTSFTPHCGQKFSRLCELLLPHAEIYKKHVICLIMRFVNSLRDDIHPDCKNSLLPGMFCLLDIIQEHETKQLNSMMDEECRALLRSIHEGYKKNHLYKGQ